MSQHLTRLIAQSRSLPSQLKFVVLLYLTSAMALCAVGAVLVVRGKLDASGSLFIGSTVALVVLFIAGILQRSGPLRWTCVVVAAGAIVAVLLRNPPWAAQETWLILRGWMKLALSCATIACLMSRQAEAWYRARDS